MWFKLKYSEHSDNSLLENYKNDGSQEWVAQLFSRYLELIYGTCLKYFKDSTKSEDACMEIYEKCLVKLKTHEVNNFKSWLYVLTKNHCLEILRKEGKALQKSREWEIMQKSELFHPKEESHIEQLEEKLKECIETLNAHQKDCIRLFYLEKASYDMIAQKLKLDWNKVRSYIQNGRRNLKTCLEAK